MTLTRPMAACALALSLALMLALGWSYGSASRAATAVPDPDLSAAEPDVRKLLEAARGAVLARPDSEDSWGRFGAGLHVHGLFPEAQACYRRALELAPEDFRWAYFLALVVDSGAEAADPLPLFEQAARLRPDYVPLLVRWGLALSLRGQLAVSRERLFRAVEIDPEHGFARRSLAEVLLALGEPSSALIQLNRAAELRPEDGAVFSALARAHQALRDAVQAQDAAERASDLDPQNGFPDPLLGEHVLALGASARHRIERAKDALQIDQPIRAIAELSQASLAHPDDPDVHYLLGLAHDRAGQRETAGQQLARAIELKPDHVRAHLELARLLEARGDPDQAILHYRRCHEIDPSDVSLLARLATALTERGDGDGVVEAYRKLAALRPEDPRIQRNLGMALARQGELASALSHFERAVHLAPDDPDGHFKLGLVYEQTGQTERARSAYEVAVQLDPDHREARRRLGLGERPRAEEERSCRAEFERIAERLYESHNPYLGRAPARELRVRLERDALEPKQRIETLLALSRELLEAGDVEPALVEIERALADAPQAAPALLSELHYQRAVVHMRRAEVQNCVMRHNADCCIFPLQGAGIHARKEPAAQAKASFERYLELVPDDLGVRWLLNVVAMALGSWPDAVEERYRLPPAAFRSEFDIGRFRDVAPQLGVDAFSLAGGVAVEDFDGDELLDIITSTYDPRGPLTYYRNDGSGGFADVSAASRADDQLGGLNIIAADHDNDGDVDLLVLRGAWLLDDGRIRKSLLRNNGDGTFTDVTRRAGLADSASPSQSAAWSDYDGDGDLDLYVCTESRKYLAHRADYPAQLFRNDGAGTFTDVARQAGVTNDRFCKAATWGDYDNDGDPDLYVSNLEENRLYRNNGDGTFADVARQAGVTEPDGRSFATWFFDYDNDGWLDLFVAGFSASIADLAAEALGLPHQAVLPRLYRSSRDGTFEDVTRPAGLAHAYLPMGANFGDLDNDGWLDMYLGTGDPSYTTLMPNVMLRNDGGKRFQDVTASGGFGHLQKGHGIAFADLDNDGDQDIYHQLGAFYPGDKFRNVLFENPGHGRHWLSLKLVGAKSNRAGFGARIRVVVDTPAGPREMHRAVGSVSSFGGSPTRQEIGLGEASAIRRLEIVWPASGTRQVFEDVALDAWYVVTEGQPQLARRHPPRLAFGGAAPLKP